SISETGTGTTSRFMSTAAGAVVSVEGVLLTSALAMVASIDGCRLQRRASCRRFAPVESLAGTLAPVRGPVSPVLKLISATNDYARGNGCGASDLAQGGWSRRCTSATTGCSSSV